jgi:predicted acyltransferase
MGEMNAASPAPRTERLGSLDALRGFDMFWITGGTAILFGLGKVIHRPGFDKFLEQFDHVPWQGLHFYDLIWPLFMFIMGAAIPLSVAKRRSQGTTDRSLLMHATRRAILMFLLGTITQGNLLMFDLSKFRPCYSVLHGLAAGYPMAFVRDRGIPAGLLGAGDAHPRPRSRRGGSDAARERGDLRG